MEFLRGSYFYKIAAYLRFFKKETVLLIVVTLARMAAALPVPEVIRRFFDSVAAGDNSNLVLSALLLSGLFLFGVWAGYLSDIRTQNIGHGLTNLIRGQLTEKILQLPYAELTKQRTGDAIARITGDSSVFQEYIMSVVINPLINAVLLLVYTAILFRIHTALSLVIVLSFPVLALIIGVFHKKTMEASFAFREGYGGMYNQLTELFFALKLIKAKKYEKRHGEYLKQTYDGVRQAGIKMNRLGSKSTHLNSLVINLNLLAVLIFGGYLTMSGQLSLAGFLSYYLILQLTYAPIESITIAFSSYQQGIGMLERVFEILEAGSEQEKQKGASFQPGKVKLDELTFAYPDSRNIFNGFSEELKPNAINVIVGPSGSGKTTLLDLLLNLYSPDFGTISIGNQLLGEIDKKDYADQIAIFTQEAIIFDTTIGQNIAYFKPGASPAEIRAAAQKAKIDDYIQTLENKYETLTGERGNRLSGGEKARIVLARVFLQKPALIFMDEPTANIDSETEQVIYDSLLELKKDSTIVLITHNRDALKIADHVIDLGLEDQLNSSGRPAESAAN